MKSMLLALATLLLLGGTLQTHAGERQAHALNRIDQGALLIDVRTTAEFAVGHFDGATNIPYQQIVAALAARDTAKDTPIVVYCRSGNRSGIAQRMLNAAGFSQVFNGGGLNDLQAEATRRGQ